MTVTLERDGRGPVEFDGERLARVSTFQPGKSRWTELSVWMVVDSEYMWVVETIGRSELDGEVDRRDAIPCRTPEEVSEALSKGGKLTLPGYQVMQLAAEEDEELVTYFEQNVKKVERL